MHLLLDTLMEKIKKEKGFLTNEEILLNIGIKHYYTQVKKAPYVLFSKLVERFYDGVAIS